MSSPRRTPRERAAEALLWGLALLVGGGVFLPAALEWVQSSRLETEEGRQLRDLDQELQELDRTLHWKIHDPQADDKLYELYFGHPYRPG